MGEISNIVGSTVMSDSKIIDFNQDDKPEHDDDTDTIMLGESAIRRIQQGLNIP